MTDVAAAAPRADEALFQKALEKLKSPRPIGLTSTVFTILVLVFVVGLFVNLRSIEGVILLVAAVVIHEAGHALGMRLFGFRDIQMFFIPFFGAAVSGRRYGAASWKEAAVSLLGPVPGILIGMALLLYSGTQRLPHAESFRFVEALLWLNLFNLLPLGFLDGGRFFERALFSRHRVLEIAFQSLGALLLALIALGSRMWLLALFAALSLGTLPARWRILSAAARLRREAPDLEADPEQLSGSQGEAVFLAAREALRSPASENADRVAEGMESILNATKRAPGFLATTGLVLTYVVAMIVGLMGIVWTGIFIGPVKWEAVKGPGWHAEFPRTPVHYEERLGPQGMEPETWRIGVDGIERFTVEVRGGGEDGRWMEAAARQVAKETRLPISASRAIVLSGQPGREYEFSTPGRTLHMRVVTEGRRRYQITTSAPRWGGNQSRFFESFALGDSTAAPAGAVSTAGPAAAPQAPAAGGADSTTAGPTAGAS